MNIMAASLEASPGGAIAVATTSKSAFASVSALAAAVSSESALAATVASRASGPSSLLLLESGRHDRCGKVKVVAKVLDAFIRDVPVVPHPAEVLLDVPAGLEGSHQLNNMKVGDLLDVIVRGLGVVLFGDENALCISKKQEKEKKETCQYMDDENVSFCLIFAGGCAAQILYAASRMDFATAVHGCFSNHFKKTAPTKFQL